MRGRELQVQKHHSAGLPFFSLQSRVKNIDSKTQFKTQYNSSYEVQGPEKCPQRPPDGFAE